MSAPPRVTAERFLERMTDAERARCARIDRVLPALRAKAAEADRTGEFPMSHVETIREAGLFGLIIPESYGGLGGGLRPIMSERKGRADGGMRRRGQLRVRREDAHRIVVRLVQRWKNERGLGVVELSRDALHELRVQTTRIREHGERIAVKALLGEHVHQAIAVGARRCRARVLGGITGRR